MRDNQETIFYLTGFQRSGTTLLCHLLDKHPDIVCAEEPEISKRLVFRQYDLLKDVHFDSIKQSLDFYKVSTDRYSEVVNSYLHGDMTEAVFLHSCYSLFNQKNASVLGAKEVMDLTAAKYDYLKRLIRFHDNKGKFIFIERDIKGVMNSFVKLGFFPPGKKWINTFNMKRFAKKYVQVVNQIDELLEHVEAHFLRYENFLRNPEGELKGIYDFLGVDSSEGILDTVLNTPSQGIRNTYKGLRPEAESAWKKNLNAKQAGWLDKHYNSKRRCNR